ncbi:MAG: ABC transporter permease [Methylovulum sp.]|nr:ABC transporter permease [Methylovulum sp.]
MTDKIACAFHASQQGTTLEATFSGDWLLSAEIPALDPLLTQLDQGKGINRLIFSTKGLGSWDSLLMTDLIRLIDAGKKQGIDVDTTTLPEGIQGLLSLVYAVPEPTGARRKPASSQWLAVLGNAGLQLYQDTQALIAFIGELAISMTMLLRGKSRLRPVDFWLNIQECGPSALPIITLISLLVGLILAFVGAVQLALFGAEMYIADMVGLGMTRDMGGLMAAVIMTGRTGATFAAQLGTMQANSEIDALKTMGFEPMSFLVLPRLLALICIMPLLCLYADLMGIIGGAWVTVNFFDVSLTQYLDRTASAVHLKDFAMGVTKCAVYGVLIALAGCLRGMQCGRSASAVGDATTSAVVTGIVFIVISDALMTMICNRLGI